MPEICALTTYPPFAALREMIFFSQSRKAAKKNTVPFTALRLRVFA
jgi:hypothetical protein